MTIVATPVLAGQLKPGDLFSTAGPEYWLNERDLTAVGERVFIRTEAPTPEDQRMEVVYRIEIVR